MNVKLTKKEVEKIKKYGDLYDILEKKYNLKYIYTENFLKIKERNKLQNLKNQKYYVLLEKNVTDLLLFKNTILKEWTDFEVVIDNNI